MVIKRREIWWASLPQPRCSEPGYRRPVLILQSDGFNQSAIQTVIVAAITSNLRLAGAPGNVMLRKRQSRLAKDSVVNVAQLVTLNKSSLADRVGTIAPALIRDVEAGLRLVLSL